MVKVLELSTLGKLTLSYDGKPVQGLGSHKAKAILVYLACTGRSYARQVLAEFFWPDRPQAQSLANLRRELAALRQPFGDGINVTRDTVELPPDLPLRLDVTAFEAKIGALQDPTSLKTALALYRGDFLEGFFIDSPAFEEWARMERERLRYRAIDALDSLIEHSLSACDYPAGIAHANRLLQMDPLREKTYGQLMRLLAGSGQREAALTQYETCKRLLKAELKVDPAAETTALYEQIRAGVRLDNLPQVRRVRGYELREPIGRGGFGEVYHAYQPGVRREVAIKVILPQYANEPEFIRRFEAEAQIVARLEHPHIVPLYDYWREPDGAYLVMRLLKESLRERLRRRALPLSETVRLVEQIAAALTVAHRSGIVHRDLKPANILFDGEGNAYLSDFGIAKVLAHSTRSAQTGAVVGSPAYLSPEQLGQGEITPSVDMYSFGILIYEALTGVHPFPPDLTPTEMIACHLSQPLPLLAGTRPEFTPQLDAVIQKATAKTAGDRFPNLLSLAAAFREAAGEQALGTPYQERRLTPMALEDATWTPADQLIALRNPYKGLRAFEEADAADFFGRATLVQQFLERLKENDRYPNFLAVVGPSGSGKSSLVKAGLLPALRKGAILGSEKWFMAHILPGAHPLEEIELALVRLATTPGLSLLTQLQENPRGLLRVVRKLFPDKVTLLLVIDQFEEAFTMSRSAEETRFFLDSLYAAVTDPHSPLKLIITLRADFYDRPLMHQDFSQLMDSRTQVVTPLSPAEIEESICAPAAQVGVTLEPGLAPLMVAEVSAQPGALPLLQYALTELFDARQDHHMTQAAYQVLGGVSGALARRAEEVMSSLDPEAQAAAGQMFLRLVTLGESVEDTRRRALQSELLALSGDPKPMEAAIRAFGASRLLSFDRDPVSRTPTVEVAHEAILREWSRLKGWLDERRSDIRQQRQLAAAATEWLASKREASYLLSGARLAQFEAWQAQNTVALTDTERGFLTASLAERARLEALERERQAKEARLRRRIQQAVGIVAVVSLIAAVISVIFSLIATDRSKVAQNAQAQAEKSAADFRLMALTNGSRAALAAGDTDTALTLAIAANHDPNPPGFAQLALAQAAYRPGTVRTLPSNLMLFNIHPSGKYLAVRQGPPPIWGLMDIDPASPRFSELLASQTLHGAFNIGWKVGTYPVFSPDGKLAFYSSRLLTAPRGEAYLMNTDPTSPDFLKINPIDVEDDGQMFTTATFGADSRTLLLAGCASAIDPETISCREGTLIAWEVDPDRLSLVGIREHVVADGFIDLGQEDPTRPILRTPYRARLEMQPAGVIQIDRVTMRGLMAQVLDGSKPSLHLVDLDPASANFGQILHTFVPPSDTAVGALSPDGKTALVTDGKQFGLWDLETYQMIRSFQLPESIPYYLEFDPSGDYALLLTNDKVIFVYDIATGRIMSRLSGHTNAVSWASFTPEGNGIVSSSQHETRFWEFRRGDILREYDTFLPLTRADWPRGADFSPDGKTLVIAGACWAVIGGCEGETGAALYDVASGAELQRFGGYPLGGFPPTKFNDDGMTVLISGSYLMTGKVWSTITGQVVSVIDDPKLNDLAPTLVLGADFRADGRSLVSAVPHMRQVPIWDITQNPARELKRIPAEPYLTQPQAIALDEGSTRSLVFVSMTSGEIVVWDLETSEEVAVLKGHTTLAWCLAVSPDKRRFLSGSDDGALILWDIDPASPAFGQMLRRFTGQPSAMYAVAFSLDGRSVFADSYGQGVRQWDIESGEMLRHYENLTGLLMHPSGRMFLSYEPLSLKPRLLRIDTLPELKAWIGEHRYVRPLTCEERAQYNIPPLCEAGE
ncbi:Serine/threonine-protein kinase PrkC [Anaerolineae bacterium]|nr:Serine/threonine-protein kinase PrkC [Anaerolineae bacterium]